ncbi:lymphocyte-specific helicase isoform X2 [Leptinotarsa decemlineata]
MAGSDESNDMIMNHPDIETLEIKREVKKLSQVKSKKKAEDGMTKEEKLREKEFHRLLKLEEKRIADENRKRKAEEKRLAEEERKRIKEEKQKAKQELLEKMEMLKQKRMEEKAIAEEERLKLIEEKRIAREEYQAKANERLQMKLEAKKIAEEKALEKRKKKALKGMTYLLSISEKYSDFFKEKIVVDPKKTTIKPLQERNKLQPTVNDMMEAVDIDNQKDSDKQKDSRDGLADVIKKPRFFEGGTLRQYQIDGVQWMKVLFDNGVNGILADEMGLGKTIQVIALICHLLERNIKGPFLIVVPLSTLPNWEAEFAKFAPKVPVVVFHGSKTERFSTYNKLKKEYYIDNFRTQPVVLTSYQVPLMESKFMSYFEWQYIIIDEGHRVKNHESKLSRILRSFTSGNRLLLTGTPLQNNISELWALLNFLMPHIFKDMDTFASLIMLEDVQDENKLLEQEEKNNIISTLHRVLKPFMLRRLKKDVLPDMVPKKELNVFCPMSKLQKDMYSFVIERNIAKLQGKDDEEEQVDNILDQPRKKRKCSQKVNFTYEVPTENDDILDYDEELIQKEEKLIGSTIDRSRAPFISRLTMQNTMMMFRKIVDHPYLVHFPLDPKSKKKELLVDEDLVLQSGKMIVLDEMLAKLKKKGHKVLIFSTLVMTLDLIEDYMLMRGHTYCRLDGGHSLEKRSECISEFNDDPKVFAFLISTRAGGLGLNLVGADTVIFFDRDWNPQVDIQAQDRCHRIGQTKPVMVYTLITRNTVDEQVITLGYQKRLLEKLVIKDGKFRKLKADDKNKAESELKELQQLLKNESDTFEGLGYSNVELDKLLDRSELYEMMKSKKSS